MYRGEVKFISLGFQDREQGKKFGQPKAIEIASGNFSENSSSCEIQTIKLDYIDKLEQKARIGNRSEIPYEHYGVVFLFDRGIMYGARVKVESTSQSVERVVLMRDLIQVIKKSY